MTEDEIATDVWHCLAHHSSRLEDLSFHRIPQSSIGPFTSEQSQLSSKISTPSKPLLLPSGSLYVQHNEIGISDGAVLGMVSERASSQYQQELWQHSIQLLDWQKQLLWEVIPSYDCPSHTLYQTSSQQAFFLEAWPSKVLWLVSSPDFWDNLVKQLSSFECQRLDASPCLCRRWPWYQFFCLTSLTLNRSDQVF